MIQWPPGSSPLARGLLYDHLPPEQVTRIIPARAGFTIGSLPPSAPTRDHPRSRGVYWVYQDPDTHRIGSSPLARGLLRRPHLRAPGRRIIPARAGFTHPRPRGGIRRRDHPRSRGVYSRPAAPAVDDAGSSPLARGLPDILVRREEILRIIPARAGFTAHPRPPRRPARDHPRSRGVYRPTGRRRGHGPGSSPLARGLR